MDIKKEAVVISSILPFNIVLTGQGDESPEFLPAIVPNKNGLNISDKDRKYFGEGRSSLKVYNNEIKFDCLGLSAAL